MQESNEEGGYKDGPSDTRDAGRGFWRRRLRYDATLFGAATHGSRMLASGNGG
jgi:hypothetical protein